MATRSNPLLVSRSTATDPIDLALLLVAVLGTAAGLFASIWPIAVLAVVPSLVADLVRGRRPGRWRRIGQRFNFGPATRSLVRTGFSVVALAEIVRAVTPVDVAALLIATMGLRVGQIIYVYLGSSAMDNETSRVTWQNLSVQGADFGPHEFEDAVAVTVRVDGLRVLTAAEVPLLIGVCLTALGVPGGAIAGAALAIVVAGLVNGIGVLQWRGRRASRIVRDTDAALRTAVEALAPEVVFYFSSPASGTYALGVWVDVINAIRQPTLVILREAVHLESLEGIRAPIVVPTTVADLEQLVPASVRVVLYPTNVVKNNDMIRIPGPMHSFIGHGDSDKVGSFSPLNRMYDEIWVAGEAAIDRYTAVDEGIDIAAIRAVGRPQLAEIARAQPGAHGDDRLTVLYAPTWEGFFDEADYSSVAPMGVRIVETAIASGARVLFKPHPLTGHRLPAASKARAEIEAALAKAGNGNTVVPPGPDSLYTAFNEADVLVSDISSVITDFLASRKPYIVTNKANIPAADFALTFPSSGAAVLLGSAVAELPDALADAAGADVLAARRAALSTRLLGDKSDPLASFLDEVDAFVARADARLHVSSAP
jgi:CDP-Glycerol:Poly(glycerophosphate) glycerophosphotransferase